MTDPQPTGPKIHDLKTIQPYFDLTHNGTKNFELRKNDRDFQIGDYLRLMEYLSIGLSGRYFIVRIDFVLKDFAGLQDGYCILGISRL